MIELGDEVKDKMSGFKGIVTGIHTYIHGCTRYTICEKKTASEKSFDEPQLKIIAKKKFKVRKSIKVPYVKPPGGPARHMDLGKSIG